MRIAAKSNTALLALLTFSCAQERNPYKDRYMQGATQGASGSGSPSANATGTPGTTGTTGNVAAEMQIELYDEMHMTCLRVRVEDLATLDW